VEGAGIGRKDGAGSRRLIHAAAAAGGAVIRERGLTREEIERRRRTARELDLGRNLRPGYHGLRWTPAQLRLLGTLPDQEVARRTGRTPEAVRVLRGRRGVQAPDGVPTRRRWSRREDALVRQLPPAEAAGRTERTLWAVYRRRKTLGVAAVQQRGRK
jgi:hypothetical protein